MIFSLGFAIACGIGGLFWGAFPVTRYPGMASDMFAQGVGAGIGGLMLGWLVGRLYRRNTFAGFVVMSFVMTAVGLYSQSVMGLA
ncbi:hypothetical protein [Flavimaricola marinus]|uniref:hypothetical protein n=1 Tax=Flavimaricola marinus TaxID=1819565 RepID=UPI001055E356|nr:hypothetical protein [Flavimaricola marinus]